MVWKKKKDGLIFRNLKSKLNPKLEKSNKEQKITEQMKEKGRKITIKLKAISLKQILKFDSPLARLIRQKLL